MQRLQNFLRSALNFGKTKITARIDAINTGLAEENTPQVLLNGGILALMFGGSLFAGITLVRFVIKNLHLFIIGTFLAAALYSAISKFLGLDIDDGRGTDSTAVELAEQEAEEVHEDLQELTYNVLAEAADYTALQRPRDVYSVGTSREKQFRMDGVSPAGGPIFPRGRCPRRCWHGWPLD